MRKLGTFRGGGVPGRIYLTVLCRVVPARASGAVGIDGDPRMTKGMARTMAVFIPTRQLDDSAIDEGTHVVSKITARRRLKRFGLGGTVRGAKVTDIG